MKKIKNIGILAHVDAGKTTLTERLLYNCGAILKLGKVDDGTTTTDSMELEKKRGITIKSTTTSFYYKDCKINILDTPGHMDFIAEVERSFFVLDGAILVISAKEGIQSQTRVIFHMLKKLNIPTILFVNKLDRLGVDLNQLYDEIKELLTDDIAIMQKATLENNIEIKDIEENELYDIILNKDDDLLEKYISDVNIDNDEYINSLIKQVHNCKIFPLFHGVSSLGIGIDQLLNGILKYLPCFKFNENDLFSGYIYKITRDEKLLKECYMKVLSGNIKVRECVKINNDPEKQIKIKNLHSVENGKVYPKDEIAAGDVAVLYNTPELKIGDILGDYGFNPPNINFNKAMLKTSVTPANKEDRPKLINALMDFSEEDPFLHLNISNSLEEMTIDIFGKVQIEIVKDLLFERYGLNVSFGPLKTIYKERPNKISEGIIHMGDFPNPYYGSIGLKIEPLPLGSGLIFNSEVSLGYLSPSFQNAVKESVINACKQGLYGWEVTDLKVTFYHGVYSSPVSTPSDFRHLTPYVLDQALRKCGTELLEPFLDFEIEVPAIYSSKAIFDIGQKRGIIDKMNFNDDVVFLNGKVPADTSMDYGNEIISYTEGKGVFYSKFSGYDIYKGELIMSPIKKEFENEQLHFMFLKAGM